MAPHSGTLAWKIPWAEEPGGLQSMGSLRGGHDWATSLSVFTFMHWRRKWQPTPVCLPGESRGRRSLVGCRPWGRTESDRGERLGGSSGRAPVVWGLFTAVIADSGPGACSLRYLFLFLLWHCLFSLLWPLDFDFALFLSLLGLLLPPHVALFL